MSNAGGREHVGVVEQIESADNVEAADQIVEPTVEFVTRKRLFGTH